MEESEVEEPDETYDDDLGDFMSETEEEVEILVSFEEDGQEYHLVRLLDPVLLVGKVSSLHCDQECTAYFSQLNFRLLVHRLGMKIREHYWRQRSPT